MYAVIVLCISLSFKSREMSKVLDEAVIALVESVSLLLLYMYVHVKCLINDLKEGQGCMV